MDTEKFVGLLVFFLVGALVLMAFVPVIQETTSATDTLTNEGYYRMNHYDVDTPVTFSWSYDKPNTVITNGVEYEIPKTPDPGSTMTLIGDTNWAVRGAFNSSGEITQLNYIGSSGSIIRASVSDSATVDLTMENGVMSGTVGASTLSNKAYEQLYIVDKDGSYIMKNKNETAYLKPDSEFFAYGNTIIDSSYLGLQINGSIEDGANVVIWRGESGFTTDTPVLNYSESSNYVDTYELSTITLNATRISDETVTAITYSYFVVPYEITSEKTIHPDTTLATVIDLLPLIAGVGLLMFLVGEFLYTRYL